MRFALYLRKSTDEQADSLETQRSNAAAWCQGRGDVVRPFEDSGISRSEFSPERRKGWFALLAAAQRGELDAVVVRDLSRVGGSIGRALVFVEDLLAAGVRLFTYADGREITGANALDCVTLALQFFGAQSEVESIRSRTREALATKARTGKVAGGSTYGYVNAPAPDGSGRVRVIDPAQAAIVRDIFRRYAAGQGLRAIAKALNAAGVASSRAGRRGTGSWAPSAIHAILRRPIYRGVVEWGRTHKSYRGGTRIRTTAHGCGLIVVEADELRIVPDELWERAHARFPARGAAKPGGAPPRYLLSGIARCGLCGGPLTVINGRDSYDPIKVYVCAYHRTRGTCTNKLRRPVASVDSVVLGWIAERLDEQLVIDVCRKVRVRLEARAAAARKTRAPKEREVAKLATEIAALASSLATAPEIARPAILEQLAARQTRHDELRVELATAAAAPGTIDLELRRLEADARRRVGNLRGIAERNAAGARRLVEGLFGTITATPIALPAGPRLRLQGSAGVGRMLADEVSNVASPARSETLVTQGVGDLLRAHPDLPFGAVA